MVRSCCHLRWQSCSVAAPSLSIQGRLKNPRITRWEVSGPEHDTIYNLTDRSCWQSLNCHRLWRARTSELELIHICRLLSQIDSRNWVRDWCHTFLVKGGTKSQTDRSSFWDTSVVSRAVDMRRWVRRHRHLWRAWQAPLLLEGYDRASDRAGIRKGWKPLCGRG